jgi:hypothetical protein
MLREGDGKGVEVDGRSWAKAPSEPGTECEVYWMLIAR